MLTERQEPSTRIEGIKVRKKFINMTRKNKMKMGEQNNEELVVWDGISKNGQYDIYEVHEDERGLMLKLISEDDGSLLEVFWDVLVLGYKNVDESFWLDTLEELMLLYGESFITSHTFFLVKNSLFSQEIEKGCKGTIKKEEMFHLKIASTNSIFDVVAFGKPKIFEIKNACKEQKQR